MISDILYDAVNAIDRYLTDDLYREIYEGETRKEITELRNAMDALRAKLETPPAPSPM